MNAPNFASILDKPMNTIERPRPLPPGTYLCVVAGQPVFGESKEKKTPYAEFTYNVVQPQDDVDADALEAYGDVKGKTVRDTYYLTENSLYRIKDMLTNCGIDVDGMKLSAAISESPNCQLLVSIKHVPSQDGTTVYANVAGTAPAE